VLALAAITDKIKENSAKAVAAFKKQGIAVYMLTGDNRVTAAVISGQAEIQYQIYGSYLVRKPSVR